MGEGLVEAGPPSERRLPAKAAAMADKKRQKGRSAGAENLEHAHQSSSKRKGACKGLLHPELAGLSSRPGDSDDVRISLATQEENMRGSEKD